MGKSRLLRGYPTRKQSNNGCGSGSRTRYFEKTNLNRKNYLLEPINRGSHKKNDALFEDTSLRTPNSKTLRLSDGTYTLGSYGFNIHFPTSEGFVEYDNTLILKDGVFSPTVSDIDLSFAFDRPSYGISFEGVRASFELINDNIIPSEAQIAEIPKQEYATKSAELFAVPNAKAQLSYCNILDGVTVSYLIYGRNIKENIVL